MIAKWEGKSISFTGIFCYQTGVNQHQNFFPQKTVDKVWINLWMVRLKLKNLKAFFSLPKFGAIKK
jgi:hypothetical protein